LFKYKFQTSNETQSSSKHLRNCPTKFVDGFQHPQKFGITKVSGSFFERTALGSYRKDYMVLINQELYIYRDKEHRDHKKMIVLTPGVFVKRLQPIFDDKGDY